MIFAKEAKNQKEKRGQRRIYTVANTGGGHNVEAAAGKAAENEPGHHGADGARGTLSPESGQSSRFQLHI